jgi:hypothetical protein
MRRELGVRAPFFSNGWKSVGRTLEQKGDRPMKRSKNHDNPISTPEAVLKRTGEVSRTIGKWSLIAVALLSTFFSTGCASIVKNKGRLVSFESNPPGATVRMKGSVIGKTPCTAMIKGAPVVTFELEGYRIDGTSLTDKFKIEPWIFGNIIFGPLGAPIGIIVDTLNGRMMRLESPYHVTFIKDNSPFSAFSYSGNPLALPSTPPPSGASAPSPAVANGAADRLKSLKDLKEKGVLSDSEYEIKKAELIKEL